MSTHKPLTDEDLANMSELDKMKTDGLSDYEKLLWIKRGKRLAANTTTTKDKQNMSTIETTPKHVGWDGQSQPIIELHAACGCKWTKDHSARLASCSQHLIAGVAR